jgi:hypothetical protein
MSELLAIEVDAATGQIIERALTQDEILLSEQAQENYEIQKTEQEAKEKARASALAKLKKLGLTDKEIAAL